MSTIYNIPDFSSFSIVSHSRFNLSESESDISIFMKEYKLRIQKQLLREEENEKSHFISFAEKTPTHKDAWLKDNTERFFDYTPNIEMIKLNFLRQMGFITCLTYSPDGSIIVTGHSTGLIQDYGLEMRGISRAK